MRILKLFIVFSLLFCFNDSTAQDKSVLPFTGIRLTENGIRVKQVDVKIDGAVLMSNRIPLNRDFEIKMMAPSGFEVDKNRLIFPGAELQILNSKAEIIFTQPNLFKENDSKGVSATNYKEVSVKIKLLPELIKAEPGCVIRIKVFDLHSTNQMQLDFPISIARPGEVLPLTKNVQEIMHAASIKCRTTGLKIKSITASVDTSIRVAPKMAYASIDLSGIDGSSMAEVMSGKESFWVYDADMKEITIPEKQLKQVGGALEHNAVNYLSKIPFRLKSTAGQKYFIRFRWENSDKSKVIEAVVVL